MERFVATAYRDNHWRLLGHGHGLRCMVGQAVWAVSRAVGRLADHIDPVHRR